MATETAGGGDGGDGRSTKSAKGAVVLFPFMAQGHIIPFLHFARLLHSHSPDLPLLFVSTTPNVRLLRSSPLLPPALRLAELDVTVFPLGSNSDAMSRTQIRAFFNTSESVLYQPFVSLVDKLDPPPCCIVSDMFLAWTVDVARKHGAGHVVLHSSGPFAMSIYNSIWRHLPHLNRISNSDDDSDCDVFLPDLPDVRIKMSQISDATKKCTVDSPSTLFYRRQAELGRRSDACLFNTASAIEGPSLGRWAAATGLPVYAVGPLGMLAEPTGELSESIARWLDRQPPRSVVYVCFGSAISLTVAQMFELAVGLEQSGRRFLWVVRAPSGCDPTATYIDSSWLPEGFERRVEESGMGMLVPKWAAQAKILAHASTGAFLSHCGWNSLMEAAGNGVAVLGWPLVAEQFYNSMLVEEVTGVGWEVGRGVDRLVPAGQVAAAVVEVLGGEKGEVVRRRAAELRSRLLAESGRDAVAAVDELVRMAVKGNK